MNILDHVLTAPPQGTRRFDPNIDQDLVAAYAAQAEEIFMESQKAIIPPDVLPAVGSVRFTAELIQLRNLTQRTSELHLILHVNFGGIRVEKDYRKIAGVTADDKLLFAVGQSLLGAQMFMTIDGERAIRIAATEIMSKELKKNGYGGDLSKLVKESLAKNDLSGLFGGASRDPDDWWKNGGEPPSPKS